MCWFVMWILSADCVVGDELFHKVLYLLVVVVEAEVFFGGEHHVLDGFYLCRRSGHTDLCGVSLHECCAPFLKLEFGVGVHDGLKLGGELGFLGG